MNILVINAGSSSLKYQLFDMKTESIMAKGICDRIGLDGNLKHTPVSNGKPVFNSSLPLPTHAEAIKAVIEKLTSADYGVIDSLTEINAVGHRVVHGGRKFSESVLIDENVLEAIKACEWFAPLHIPANLMGIYACREAIPGIPQVAVFDTAFHRTIPDYANIYPIPYRYYQEYDILRYGFHGTSHRFVSAKAIEYLGGNAAGTKIITCHLGNGSSLAAVKDGKSVDTTMGITPLEGMPMGTRAGSVDPALVYIIANLAGGDVPITYSMDILNKESGVLGISGISNDFRDLESAAGIDAGRGCSIKGAEINKRAKLALDIFCYDAVKYIGSYIAVLGGIDALVFTAGIGENSPHTRACICGMLNGVGICIDETKNGCRCGGELLNITGEGSIAKVLVIPTDEELVIARDTISIING